MHGQQHLLQRTCFVKFTFKAELKKNMSFQDLYLLTCSSEAIFNPPHYVHAVDQVYFEECRPLVSFISLPDKPGW